MLARPCLLPACWLVAIVSLLTAGGGRRAAVSYVTWNCTSDKVVVVGRRRPRRHTVCQSLALLLGNREKNKKHSSMIPWIILFLILSAVRRHLGRPGGRSSLRLPPPRLSGGRTDTQLPYELNRRSPSCGRRHTPCSCSLTGLPLPTELATPPSLLTHKFASFSFYFLLATGE